MCWRGWRSGALRTASSAERPGKRSTFAVSLAAFWSEVASRGASMLRTAIWKALAFALSTAAAEAASTVR